MSFSSTPSEGGCSRLRARFAIDGQALDAISPLTAVVRPAYGRLEKHQGINQASSHEPVTAHGWQRVLVPSSIRLSTLHVVLLQSMGWDGGRLHEFEFADARYGIRDLDWPDDLLIDESRVTLNKALGGGVVFTWIYDFGDHWTHKIKVARVDVLPAALKLQSPMCMAGARACPPEDVGGPPGYEAFPQAIADPNHPEHGDMTEWIGDSFDPAALNLRAVQGRLHALKP